MFLLYPSGGTWYRYLLAVITGALVAATASALIFYPDVPTFHAALMEFGDRLLLPYLLSLVFR